eukprot:TRINITY_DN7814_c0_g1_i11.p1 TRINITY_DN7814_c0_g1~~TRINITY_DN7814_c0_g1_i11.p1  ORF type:complete len:321 (+),score=76.03 TRINITY_DN7814_c0_g1_i11:216-1178(+)
MIKIVLPIAIAVLGAIATYDNETKEIDSCDANSLKGCQQQDSLLYSDDDVDMSSFQMPKDFDVNKVVEAITTGDGWIKLEGMYSEEDVMMARERIYHHNHADKYISQNANHQTIDEAHNKFSGMVWALFNKGRIFEKMAQHPAILNVSDIVLGERSQMSSFAANTVLPGQGGQLPHLDYPYYRLFYPSSNPHIMDTAPPLSVQFVTLLTDFNMDNGGTAIRPNSHKLPRYPDDKEDFYKHAIQMEGKAGDVVVFAGAMQHCAMPNRSKGLRAGILQHMAPVYIKPFEAIMDYVNEDVKARATPEMKRILALEHPYPVLKK